MSTTKTTLNPVKDTGLRIAKSGELHFVKTSTGQPLAAYYSKQDAEHFISLLNNNQLNLF